MISCVEVFRLISDYVDGAVDARLRARMEAHFKDCDHCSAVLDGTNNVVRLVADGQTFEIPAVFRKKLYTKLDAHLKGLKKSH